MSEEEINARAKGKRAQDEEYEETCKLHPSNQCTNCTHTRAAHDAATKPYSCLYCSCSGFKSEQDTQDEETQKEFNLEDDKWEALMEQIQTDSMGFGPDLTKFIWEEGLRTYLTVMAYFHTHVQGNK